ncbi:hypothetical protein PMT9312_0690 [Prochlorococcus marinus str. MIT 9312]|uniref:Uncharacterized protein n=1 Tax=Prochlorococcus marinus (strain MIT 9312) TaxID=74546 RepID=Q31BJ5_PROM9|nr:hypothetical protein [Prochlorococcus marinus]ABB49750.1 hypothetical protein PMT9312_0690 [Prochlorococcus marinus str. MIT 9312]
MHCTLVLHTKFITTKYLAKAIYCKHFDRLHLIPASSLLHELGTTNAKAFNDKRCPDYQPDPGWNNTCKQMKERWFGISRRKSRFMKRLLIPLLSAMAVPTSINESKNTMY